MKKDILQVFFPNLIKMFVTIITTFLIPKWLSVDEYGYIKLFQLYVSYIGLSSLGYCDGVFIKYGGKEIADIPPKKLADEQATLIIWQLALSIGIVCVAVIQKDFIIAMFGLSFVPSVMVTYFLTFFQAVGMFRDYSRLYNMHSVFTILTDLFCLFVLRTEKGAIFVIAAVAVNYIVSIYMLLAFNIIHKVPLGRFRWVGFKENVRMGIMIAAGNMAYVVFSGIDKWFVKLNEGMTSFSYYSFAVQLLAAINMFANPIAYTLFSHFSKKKSQSFEYSVKRMMLVWLFFLLTGVYVLKAIIKGYISKYMIAIPVIEMLFLSQIFYSLNYSIYVNLFKVYKKQKRYFLNIVIIILLSVVFNFGFYFGITKNMISFAYATTLCMILWALLNLRSFTHLRLHKRDFLFVLLTVCLYFTVNKMEYFLFGALLYGMGYLILVFILMNDIFWQTVEQVKEIGKRIVGNKGEI